MLRKQTNEVGSVLLTTLILMISFGGLVAASLAMMVSENRKLAKLHLAQKVEMLVAGKLEFAMNVVNASAYDSHLQNEALKQAMADPNRLIRGTDVSVERIGTTANFILRAVTHQHGIVKHADAVVRQSSPASSNNLLVIDHPVGISGSPRGTVHTNKYIDFYFPNGNYRDQVTAGTGFNFVAGATASNTSFSGAVNSGAPQSDPLAGIIFDDLWAEADRLAVTENLISEVTLLGDKASVKLFKPAYTSEIPVTKTERVISGYEPEEYIVQEPIHQTYNYTVTETVYRDESFDVVVRRPVYAYRDATRTVTDPVYENRSVAYAVDIPIYGTRTVQRQRQQDVWVPYSSGSTTSSGGTVGSTAPATGYWKTETVIEDVVESYITGYRQETRTRIDRVKVGETTRTESFRQRYIDSYRDVTKTEVRKVADGTRDVAKTGTRITGYQAVTKTRDVAVYEDQETVTMQTVQHDEEYVRTEVVPVDGTIYLRGDIRKLSGQIDGRLSLITSGAVKITGDVVYVDAAGETRMLNGKDHTQPYEQNPNYDGGSLLAVMAQGDVVYAKDAPRQLEVNASLISANGSVKFEGVQVSEDGSNVWTEYAEGENHVLDSLRRLGGIVSRQRPIATFIDESGRISAGFEYGQSIMDQNLILTSGDNPQPPFMFESPIPTWTMRTRGTSFGAIH